MERIVFFDLSKTFEMQLRNKFMFDNFPININFYTGNIRDIKGSPNIAYLSPANSFGYMDGGVDAAYSEMFPGIQKLIQSKIKSYPFRTALGLSYLPIGSAILADLNLLKLQTGFETIPLNSNIVWEDHCYLISAPTMWHPQDVSKTNNAYYALMSTLSLIKKYNTTAPDHRKIKTLMCPGLCTGYGKMSYAQSATQIEKALAEHFAGNIVSSIVMEKDPTSILCEVGVEEQPKIYQNSEIKDIQIL